MEILLIGGLLIAVGYLIWDKLDRDKNVPGVQPSQMLKWAIAHARQTAVVITVVAFIVGEWISLALVLAILLGTLTWAVLEALSREEEDNA